ncbi:MAG: hypothetical protein JRF56_10640 [Deltaproteobacteria bacterium]|jgi:hypothetical protein|nr:hypothetical protein [Deltaproteobacteria bacterium]
MLEQNSDLNGEGRRAIARAPIIGDDGIEGDLASVEEKTYGDLALISNIE